MKNKAKFYFILLGIVVLGFSILLGFLLDDSMPIEIQKGFTLYFITKAFVTLALVVFIVYCAYNKKDRKNSIIQMTLTILLQFLPLLVRALLSKEEPKFILSVVLVFVIIIIYLGLVFSLDLLTDKFTEVKPKLEGKIRNVVDEDNYYDENGKFVGASKK